jgi:hypothetical protein
MAASLTSMHGVGVGVGGVDGNDIVSSNGNDHVTQHQQHTLSNSNSSNGGHDEHKRKRKASHSSTNANSSGSDSDTKETGEGKKIVQSYYHF